MIKSSLEIIHERWLKLKKDLSELKQDGSSGMILLKRTLQIQMEECEMLTRLIYAEKKRSSEAAAQRLNVETWTE